MELRKQSKELWENVSLLPKHPWKYEGICSAFMNCAIYIHVSSLYLDVL